MHMKCQASSLSKRTIIDAAQEGLRHGPCALGSLDTRRRASRSSCARWRSTPGRKTTSSMKPSWEHGRTLESTTRRSRRGGFKTPSGKALGARRLQEEEGRHREVHAVEDPEARKTHERIGRGRGLPMAKNR
jgi:hypothetical protein